MRACLLLLVCGCGGDGGESCPGPGDAGVAGVVATSASDTATYGDFRWGANNDCPAAGSSVVSVTVIGEQVGSAMMAGIGLCFPRPDLIDGTPVELSDTTKVLFESMTAQVGDCRYTKAASAPLGTVSFGGFCTQVGAAFSIQFSGGVPASKQCGGGPTELVTMSLSGTAAVTARQ
jgi:hypothetical protein